MGLKIKLILAKLSLLIIFTPIITAEHHNLNYLPQCGYLYLDRFFHGKMEINMVFPCLHFESYKIHLMPKEEDLQSTIQKLLDETNNDPELLDLIGAFKYIENFERFNENQDYNMPIVVIYAASGKENAQKLLNKIYELFKNQEGLNLKPRWNEQVTSLIYFSQGNGDQKIQSRYDQFFEPGDYKGNGKIYFKANVTGTHRDYHLINPAKRDKLKAKLKKLLYEYIKSQK